MFLLFIPDTDLCRLWAHLGVLGVIIHSNHLARHRQNDWFITWLAPLKLLWHGLSEHNWNVNDWTCSQLRNRFSHVHTYTVTKVAPYIWHSQYPFFDVFNVWRIQRKDCKTLVGRIQHYESWLVSLQLYTAWIRLTNSSVFPGSYEASPSSPAS